MGCIYFKILCTWTTSRKFAKKEKILETLIQTIRIYNQDIGRKFGRKWIMLIKKSGKIQITEGIEVPNQERIRTLAEKRTLKYLRRTQSNKRRKK